MGFIRHKIDFIAISNDTHESICVEHKSYNLEIRLKNASNTEFVNFSNLNVLVKDEDNNIKVYQAVQGDTGRVIFMIGIIVVIKIIWYG